MIRFLALICLVLIQMRLSTFLQWQLGLNLQQVMLGKPYGHTQQTPQILRTAVKRLCYTCINLLLSHSDHGRKESGKGFCFRRFAINAKF
jgi:hypothetical protein